MTQEEIKKISFIDENNSLQVSNNDSNYRNEFLCGVVEGFYGRPWSLEQRKDLFEKLKSFEMNVYMYAPKDERTMWRELYSVEDAEQLSLLISQAKLNNILFIYTLSPGLDIAYSNPKDMTVLKRKLDQIKNLGCPGFALLFDDIEPELNESDREAFKSFASAQVSVTNEIYQYLDQPYFVFCPTEYCSSRAVPNVQNSDYLATIGSKLHPSIDIMWTGNRVISQTINLNQIQELSDVLKRKPVIWDNLHANDYDQKRLFLGPYKGRSTKVIGHLKGVLTNPNCEYEANFIPIHTLAQWSKCSSEVAENFNSDVKLESQLENGSIEDIPVELGPNVYHPKKALRVAINEWLMEFNKPKSPRIKSNSFSSSILSGSMALLAPPPINIDTSSTVIENYTTSLLNTQSNNSNQPFYQSKDNSENGISENNANKQIDVDKDFKEPSSDIVDDQSSTTIMDEKCSTNISTQQILEPMECNTSPDQSPKALNSNLDVPMIENSSAKGDDAISGKSMSSMESNEDIQAMEAMSVVMDEETKFNTLTYDDIALLVDLFYLPFEHGQHGVQVLQEFHWLKTNGYIVSEYRRKRSNESVVSSEINEWYDRAAKFNEMTLTIGRLLTRLTFCKNRSLCYELYPYVWDIKGVISLLNSYVKWVGFSKGYKEAFQNGEQEPWLFRGGLTGELQRMLPVESVSDLFLYKAPESPTSRVYTIRPYLPTDLTLIYEVCFKNFEKTSYLEDQQTLVGDKLIGSFLALSPEYCFVVEDDVGLCGYALAALDAKKYFVKFENAWVPELLKKYPICGNNQLYEQQAQQDVENICSNKKNLNKFIEDLHKSYSSQATFTDPEAIMKIYPSLLNMVILSNIIDSSVPKRMLACVIAALKANGSKGIYCRVSNSDKKLLDFYLKLGFHVITLSNATESDDVYLGRII